MNTLVILVDKFKDGDPNALLSLLNHQYIKSTLDSLYYSKNNYNELTGQRILDKDEIVSEAYIVLSKRLMKFSTTQPKQVTTYVTKTVRGHITDLLHKRYDIKEYCTDIPYTDSEAYNEHSEFENDTLDSIDTVDKHLKKIMKEFPIFCDYHVNQMTYEQIAAKYSCAKSQAWRLVNEEFAQAKEYLENVLDTESLMYFQEQYSAPLR